MIDDEATQSIKRAWGGISKHNLNQKSDLSLKEILFILLDNRYPISGGFGSSFKDAIVLEYYDGDVSTEYQILKDLMNITGINFTIIEQNYGTHEGYKYDWFEIITNLREDKEWSINIDKLKKRYLKEKIKIYFKLGNE